VFVKLIENLDFYSQNSILTTIVWTKIAEQIILLLRQSK